MDLGGDACGSFSNNLPTLGLTTSTASNAESDGSLVVSILTSSGWTSWRGINNADVMI